MRLRTRLTAASAAKRARREPERTHRSGRAPVVPARARDTLVYLARGERLAFIARRARRSSDPAACVVPAHTLAYAAQCRSARAGAGQCSPSSLCFQAILDVHTVVPFRVIRAAAKAAGMPRGAPTVGSATPPSSDSSLSSRTRGLTLAVPESLTGASRWGAERSAEWRPRSLGRGLH